MSLRTKLLITAAFLVLLAIPASYIALSWNAPTTLEFRYLGQGAPVMHRVSSGNELCVPFKIEVRNPHPFPMHLWTMELMGLVTSSESPSPVFGGTAGGEENPASASRKLNLPIGNYRYFSMDEVEDGVPPIPARGSLQVEIYVVQSTLPQVDPASLHIEYVSSSVTKNEAMKLAHWTERKLWEWFEYNRRVGGNLHPDRHDAPLRDAHGQPVRFTP